MKARTKKSVLVTGASLVPEEATALIERRGFAVQHIRNDKLTDDELHTALRSVSGYLIGGYEEPSAGHFDAATDLETVAFVGTDFQVYVPGWRRAFELGIAVVNTPGANAVSVAEFTILLMLTMARPFTQRVATDAYANAPLISPGLELSGRTLGIIGAGRVGARVAAAGKGLGMRVVYHAPRRNEALEHAVGLVYVSQDDLLATSDVVSLHRPGPALTERRPAMGRPEFESLKPGAILINVSHPDLVDPVALASAIDVKGVRAAFDGTRSGDPWDRLMSLGPERFLCVPSMAYHTVDANRRAALQAANAVCDVLTGAPSDLVNNQDFLRVRETVGRVPALIR
jgi:D-3-phosphoglycerate dehydrogenase